MSIYPLFDHVLVAEILPCKFFGRSIGIKMFKFLCFFLLDANQKSEPSSTEEFLIDPSCKPASYWRSDAELGDKRLSLPNPSPLPTLIKRKAGMEKGNADSMRVLLLIKSLYVYFCTQTCTSTISGDSERQKEQLVLHYTVLPCTSPHSSFVSGPFSGGDISSQFPLGHKIQASRVSVSFVVRSASWDRK